VSDTTRLVDHFDAAVVAEKKKRIRELDHQFRVLYAEKHTLEQDLAQMLCPFEVGQDLDTRWGRAQVAKIYPGYSRYWQAEVKVYKAAPFKDGSLGVRTHTVTAGSDLSPALREEVQALEKKRSEESEESKGYIEGVSVGGR